MDDPRAGEVGPPLRMGSLGRTTALVTAGGLVGQIFAAIRTLFVGAQVGVSPELDALLVAQVMPVIVGAVIASGLRQATVPAYLGISASRGRHEASGFAGFVLSWSVIVAVGAMALLYLWPMPVIDVSGPGLGGESRQDALVFLRLLAPILVLSVAWVTLATVCQAERAFRPIALGLALNPIVSLVTTVALWDRLGLQGVALGLDLGYVISIAIVAGYLIWRGLRPRLTLWYERAELGRFIRHALPLVAGATVVQSNQWIDRAIASILGAGSVSALSYGQMIVQESVGSLNLAWLLVLYPMLIHLAHPSQGRLGEGTSMAIRYAIAYFMPLAVGTIALAPLGVQVAFERGAFDASAVRTTSLVVAAFAPMFLLTMIQPVLAGAHNARRRGTVVAAAAGLNALLNLALDLTFGLSSGVAGVALSTSVTVMVVALVLAVALRRWEPDFALRPIFSTSGRALLASIVPGVVVGILVWGVLPKLSFAAAFAVLAGLAAFGAVMYLTLAKLLQVDELNPLFTRLGGLLRRSEAAS